METGLGPTAAAWGQLSSINTPGSTGLDFSVRSSNSGLLDLHSHHWGPIVYPQTEAGGDARSQQRGTLNAPPGPEGHSSSENMTNSSEHSQRVSSSEALRSSSSASSLAPQGATDGIRGGLAESSGRGWADLSGDMQQRLSMGQGQQPRRSSDSFASIPRVYSNERIAPEHRSFGESRLPTYSSHERLDQLGGLSVRQASSSDMEGRRPDSSPSLHRRGTGSGTEDDIFSALGGLEIDAEHRSSSVSQCMDNMSHVSSRSQMSVEPAVERETRSLVVKDVNPDVSDAEFKQLFEQYGDLRTLYTACKEQGWLMISYWNIIAAKLAKVNLDRQIIHGRQCGVQFAPNKEAKELQEGMVTLTNHNPDLTDQDICRMLQAEYGEVYSIMTPPDNPHKRHIEFCDVRHAQAAKQALEGIAAKIPTISEQGTVGVDVPSGMRNVQSTHTFFPQAGPAGQSSVQQDMRPHSWDNSGAQLNNMAMQSQMLHQLNPQLLASLSSQGLFNQQGGLAQNGSSGNLASLQADVDSLMRANYMDSTQGNNAAMQVQALLNGSTNSLSSLQGGSHPNLAGMSGRGMGPGPNSSPLRSGPSVNMDSPSALLSAGSQHLSASQLFSLGSGNQQVQNAEQGGNLSRSNASMSTGNLADLYNQPGLLGNGMQGGLRGVASTSNIWDGQGDGSGWGGLSNNPNQAALQAQALALQLQLAGGLDQGAGNYLPGAPNSLTAFAQQHLLQQQLQNLSLQTNLSLQQNTAALLAKVQQQAGALRGLAASGHARKGSRDDLAGGRLSRRVQDPAAEAERKAAQEKMYSLDMDKVAKGEDKRTTLMIKNIPNKYTQKMLLATIDEDFRGHYDFFYLPIDFKNKCNVGYAFINMILPEYIPSLFQRFHTKKWEKFNSEKVCHISYARIQGKSSLVTHFQNSSLLHEDKRCRPIIFRTDGHVAGEQEPFPAGPNMRSRPARPGSAGTGLNNLAASPSLGALPGSNMAAPRHPGAGW